MPVKQVSEKNNSPVNLWGLKLTIAFLESIAGSNCCISIQIIKEIRGGIPL
jgi:hypothetical protein